jgi:hypothetical protein
MTLDPQDKKSRQDEDAQGQGCNNNPFHKKLVSGGARLVILPDRRGRCQTRQERRAGSKSRFCP